MPYICQDFLPLSPWIKVATRKLPGVQPVKSERFFLVDEVFKLQLEYREKLLNSNRKKVYFSDFDSEEVAQELLNFVLKELRKNELYSFEEQSVRRPDGVIVDLVNEDPLSVAARLVQEDLLLLRKERFEHILRAGVLCFPASWTLNEKKGKSLTNIHGPVVEYDKNIASRVEKMFSNLRPEVPIWRANYLFYEDYELFQPRLETDERGNPHKEKLKYMRVERQTLKKLDESEVILFAIHTFVVPYKKLSDHQKQSLKEMLV